MKENRSCLYQYTYDLFIQSDTVFTLSSCVFGLSNPLIYVLLNKIGCLMLILFSDLWYFDTNHLYTMPLQMIKMISLQSISDKSLLFPLSWFFSFFGSYFWLLLVWLLLWNSSRFDNTLAPCLGYILTNAWLILKAAISVPELV